MKFNPTTENDLLESELKYCFTYNEYNLNCDHQKQLRTHILSSHNKKYPKCKDCEECPNTICPMKTHDDMHNSAKNSYVLHVVLSLRRKMI